jgi:predicted CoA-binding protein
VDTNAVERFLSGHRFAVVGASDDPKNFGRTIVAELQKHGYEVVPVHPRAATVGGLACVADLASVPDPLDGVIVMVAAPGSTEVVQAAIARGVHRIWLFQGVGGAGAVSDEALALCAEHEVDVVAGACPLMFLEPVGWFHRMHRSVRRRRGALVAVAG